MRNTRYALTDDTIVFQKGRALVACKDYRIIAVMTKFNTRLFCRDKSVSLKNRLNALSQKEGLGFTIIQKDFEWYAEFDKYELRFSDKGFIDIARKEVSW